MIFFIAMIDETLFLSLEDAFTFDLGFDLVNLGFYCVFQFWKKTKHRKCYHLLKDPQVRVSTFKSDTSHYQINNEKG